MGCSSRETAAGSITSSARDQRGLTRIYFGSVGIRDDPWLSLFWDKLNAVTKRKSKGAYMISAVAEMYGIHPQTLRLYEREGLLKPSRTEGNTRLYTDEDLQRLEFILSLARDLGVNISGMAIILQMRERMEEMQRQIQEFVQYIQQEVLTRASAAADPSKGAIVPVKRPMVVPMVPAAKKK
jgi:MerR family transcriptional regulator/heat shock protein HspR